MADQVEGEVERGNRGDRSDREALDQSDGAGAGGVEVQRFVSTPEALDLLRGQREHADGAGDFGARIADWLAGAIDNCVLEFAAPLADSPRDRGKQVGAPSARESARFAERARRRGQRGFGMIRSGARNSRRHFAGERIGDLVMVIAVAELAVDEQLIFA